MISAPIKRRLPVLLLALFFTAGGKAYAADGEDFGHSAAFGINYPGAELKFFLADKFAAELRGQYAAKVLTGGARFYY